MGQAKAIFNKCVRYTSGLLGMCLRHSVRILSIPQVFHSFNDFIKICISQGLTLPEGVLSASSCSAWTLASTRYLWFSSHKSCSVNWFSKQSSIMVDFTRGWYLRTKGSWIAIGAFDPSLLMKDFAIGHIAWGVTSVPYFHFPPFKCLTPGHFSDGFRDTPDCSFTSWIPGFWPQFS
jgi:hypothetical protein